MTDTISNPPGFNFGLDLLRATRQHADKVLFQAPQGIFTYRGMGRLMVAYALHLRRRGVRPGSLVALASLSGPDNVAMAGAAALLGAAWVDGTEAALRAGLGISHVVHAMPDGAITGANVFRLDRGWSRIPPGMEDVTQVRFAGYAAADAAAMIRQSSGSTGMPKFMVSTAGKMAIAVARTVPTERAAEVILPLGPAGSAITMVWSLHVMLRGGRILVGMDREAAAVAGAQAVIGSPRQLLSFLDGRDPTRRPQVGLGILTGAEAPPALRRRLLEYFGKLRIGYGTTETGRLAAHLVDAGNIEDMSVGLVHPFATIEVVDEEHRLLPPGKEGVIRVKTPSMVPGYLGRTDAGRSVFRDGWFYPGDIGVLTAEGRLTLRGRVDDRLNLGGVKIDAAAIDRVLAEIEGLADGAAFGLGGREGGPPELAVALVAAPGADEGRLREAVAGACRGAFGARGEPKAVFFLPELPRNANGKVLRRDLAASLV